MNVIVLFGSPHADGSCSAMLGAFLDGLGDSVSFIAERFCAYGMDIAPCADCGVCRGADACAFGDLDGFDAALRGCDAMVIASPVYHYSFPAPLKALFDRTQRYYYAMKQGRPVFGDRPRPASLLLSAGQRREDGGVIKLQLSRILPPLGMELCDTVIARDTDSAAAGGEILSECRSAGAGLGGLLRERGPSAQ